MSEIEETRVCKTCLQITPLKDMAKTGIDKTTGKQKTRADCKKCHCERVRFDQENKRIIDNPHRYWECDSCGKIWAKYYRKRKCDCTDNIITDGNGANYEV